MPLAAFTGWDPRSPRLRQRVALGACTAPLVWLAGCGEGEAPMAPPDPYASFALTADPASGPPPLTVTFRVTPPGPAAGVVRFELDAEGDGTFERRGTTPADLARTVVFAQRGSFTARLRAFQQDGDVREITTTVTVTEGGIELVGQAEFEHLEAPAIAPDGSALYLATGRTAVRILDPLTLARTGEIGTDLPSFKILVTRDGAKAYVLNLLAYGTAIVDLRSGLQVGRLPSGFRFADLTADGGVLFLLPDPARIATRHLEARDVRTDAFVGLVEFPGVPQSVDFADGVDYGAALILEGAAQNPTLSVALFDPRSLRALRTIPLAEVQNALWAAIRPGTSEIYVAVDVPAGVPHPPGPRPRLVVLDAATGSREEIDLGATGSGQVVGYLAPFEWSAGGRYLYLSGDRGFFVVDAAAKAVAERVPAAVAPGCDLVLHPFLPRVFVTDYEGTLTVLELASFPPR